MPCLFQSEKFTDQGSNLSVMVSSMCQPDGGFWLNSILDVFMRVFWMRFLNQ